MTAGIYNFILEQGVTMPKSFNIKDSSGNIVSLTGATIEMQARKSKDSTTPLFTLTSENGAGFTIDASHSVHFVWSSINFNNLDFSTAYYDIYITFADLTVMRAVEGVITYSKRVTQ